MRGKPFAHHTEEETEPARATLPAMRGSFQHHDGFGEEVAELMLRSQGRSSAGRGRARFEADELDEELRASGKGRPLHEDGGEEQEEEPARRQPARALTTKGRPFQHHEEADEEPPARIQPAAKRASTTIKGRPFAHHLDEGEEEEQRSSLPTRSTASTTRSTTRKATVPKSNDPRATSSPSPKPGGKPSSPKPDASFRRGMVPFGHHGAAEGNMGDTAKKKLGKMTFGEAVQDGIDAVEAVLQRTSGMGINDPDRSQVTGATPLMLALDQGPLQDVLRIAEMLLDHGAQVNAVDISGNTPLMYCVDREPREAAGEPKDIGSFKLSWARVLLDRGADPSKKNQEAYPMSALDKCQIQVPIAQEIRKVVNLRQLEKSLPAWHQGEPLPKVPIQVARVLQEVEDASVSKPTAVMEAYSKAVEVLRDSPSGLKLDFPESDLDFVPAGSHAKTEALRKALECGDAILRKYGKLPRNLSGLFFQGLLPLQAGIYEQYTKRYSSAEAKKSLAHFVAGKNERFLKGYNWAFSSLIEVPEAEDLAAAVELAESFPDGKGFKKPVQIKDSLEDVMVDAVRMQRRVVLLAAAVAEKAKATHLVVHKSGGGRGEPQSKRLFRSHEKVCLGTGPSALLDVARGGIECPSMKSVCQALNCLLDEAKAGKVELLRIKMRFHQPSDGGWRDALVNFRFTDDDSKHVCELQVMHKRMMTIRADMGAHKDYAQIRGAIEILELHGVNWLDEAGSLATEERGASGSAFPIGVRGDSTGSPAKDVAKLEARVEMLEEKLREKDKYIMELELQLLAAREGPEAAILAKFKHFDKDGDGVISRVELRSMMYALDSTLSDDEITTVFENMDRDGSGNIDYQEFVRWVCHVGTMETR